MLFQILLAGRPILGCGIAGRPFFLNVTLFEQV
jgi:hypothetical protein